MDTLKNDTLIASYLSKLVLGEVQQHKNLAVVPLFTFQNHGPEYLTLQEGFERDLLSVSEISLGGSVPQLQVVNRADLPVLLVDGEELTGAKQNRVLNTSILLREKSETVIPVSCTEQGRWNYTSRHFSHSGHIMAHKLRKLKSSTVAAKLRRETQAQQHSGTPQRPAPHHSYASDQEAVWDGVQEVMMCAEVASPSHAMHDVFTAKLPELNAYLKAFPPLPEQKGLLVFINGVVAGLDLLSLPRAYQLLHPTLLRSYALDAILEHTDKTVDGLAEKATTFFEQAAKCQERKYPSIGYGTDHRFEGEAIAGSALVSHECLVHLALFTSN